MPEHPNEHVHESVFIDHLWQEISQQQPNRWVRNDVRMFVKTFTRTIVGALGSGYVLEFRNFGKFRVVSKNPVRHGFPGRPGYVQEFPARCKVLFVPTPNLVKLVAMLDPAKYPRGKTRAERPVPLRKRKADPT